MSGSPKRGTETGARRGGVRGDLPQILLGGSFSSREFICFRGRPDWSGEEVGCGGFVAKF